MKKYLEDSVADLQMKINSTMKTIECSPVDSYLFKESVDKLQLFLMKRNHINGLLRDYEEEAPAKIVPVAGIQERTPEETDAFHNELIDGVFAHWGLRVNLIKTGIGGDLKKLNQYFTCIASLQWCAGQIATLDEIEAELRDTAVGIGDNLNHHLDPLKQLVDDRIGPLYSAHAELQHNCAVLEKELNLNE
jgi:hypothetical protein